MEQKLWIFYYWPIFDRVLFFMIQTLFLPGSLFDHFFFQVAVMKKEFQLESNNLRLSMLGLQNLERQLVILLIL